MDGKINFRSLALAGFLSFPNTHARVTLEALNVIIGANASGKSNFIKGFAWLQSLVDSNKGFKGFFSRTGGRQYFYNLSDSQYQLWGGATIWAEMNTRDPALHCSYKMTSLKRSEDPQLLQLNEDLLLTRQGEEHPTVLLNRGDKVLGAIRMTKYANRTEGKVTVEKGTFQFVEEPFLGGEGGEFIEESVLNMFRGNAADFAATNHVIDLFSRIWIGERLHTDGLRAMREPQSSDTPRSTLNEDFSRGLTS